MIAWRAIAPLLVLVFTTASVPPCQGQPAPCPDPMAFIPAGEIRPLFRDGAISNTLPVAAFLLDRRPVSNAEFLEFVQQHPRWRRSRVVRLFADANYLRPWTSDLDPGGPESRPRPVTHVSWFAAKAYADWKGLRLPTTDEWELAATAGYTRLDGRSDPIYRLLVDRWVATPMPRVLPAVGMTPPNFHGIQDLLGLVWEWTSDFNSALVTGDARGDTGLERQLFCGAGSVGALDPSDFPGYLRYGFRSSLRAAYALPNLGFRCARDVVARPNPTTP